MELKNLQHIQSIFDNFDHQFNFLNFEEIKSGHINDTFKIETTGNTAYILQKINHFIFTDVAALTNNKVLISKHLNKFSPSTELEFIKLKNNENFYCFDGNSYWNLTKFIDHSITFEIVPNSEIAFEAGKLLGNFHNHTATFKASNLVEIIPNFHNMHLRLHQFSESLKKASQHRKLLAKKLIEKVEEWKDHMLIIQQLKDEGKIPVRVTHNDTKISNSLFSNTYKGICMIDLDTVMPGIVHYDFGDALRTICNTAKEDEQDLEKINFNKEFYDAYYDGFLHTLGSNLSELEIKLLPLAVKTMIFIIGLRFLTDFLNNDIYFKTEFENHNLIRAMNQFTLIERLENEE